MKKLNICIVGYGSIGKRYLKILKKYFKTYNIYLFRRKNDSNVLKDVKQIFKRGDLIKHNIDAAIICTPTAQHIKDATYFCENNIPVLVEKPISHNLKKIKNFSNLVKRKKTRVQVGYVLKFKKELDYIKKLIDKSKIISAQIVCTSNIKEWNKNKNYKLHSSVKKKLGGGVLLELSHEIDYARYLFGDFKSTYCKLTKSKNLGIDVEDQADLILITKDNIRVNIHLSFSSFSKIRECKINTINDYIYWDILNNSVYSKKKGHIYKDPVNFDINYLRQLRYFFKNIGDYKEDKHTILNGIKTLNVIMSSKKSNKLDREVIIK